MPCPDFDVSICCRSNGSSVIASAAYNSGERIYSEYDFSWKDFTRKDEVVWENISLPKEAPDKFLDRTTLWNSVEKFEKSWNAQLARKIRMALPKEIPREEQIKMVEEYIDENFVDEGMCADYAIHDSGEGNPHVHVLLTMRSLDENGNWNPKSRKVYILDENGEKIKLPSGNFKTRKENLTDWDNRDNCEKWRQAWADIQNEYLKKNNRKERVDLRSYERQGVDKIPTVHEGPAVTAMERRGIKTNIGNLNRDIRAQNERNSKIKTVIRKIKEWINDLSEKRKQILEILKEAEEQEPELVHLLHDYLEVRIGERENWSKMAQLKGMAKDYANITDVVNYLKKNHIDTVDDLKEKIYEIADKQKPFISKIKSNETRIKKLDRIFDSYEEYKKYESFHKEYLKKNFKVSKEKYYAEHKEEIDRYKSAYHFLKKNAFDVTENGKDLATINLLRKEKENLQEEIKSLREESRSINNEIRFLGTVQFYISKVQSGPKTIAEVLAKRNEKESVRDLLKQKQLEVLEREKNRPKDRDRTRNIDISL